MIDFTMPGHLAPVPKTWRQGRVQSFALEPQQRASRGSSDFIGASGTSPHQEAGHMTEGRQPFTAEIKTLAKGPSTYDPLENNIGGKRP